jgi:beta-galactosidase
LVPLDENFIRTKKPDLKIKADADKPCNFFAGSFELSEIGDTYFDMSGYSKGVLYVNGHNLGRFWNIGPQQGLYCPASWLKKGKNEILVFDLHQLLPAPVKGAHSLR